MIATQHSGEGKAHQYFLRGFSLDHGTDFLTQIEGVPINQLSHSHGQGWTDTNFLIPELIETLEYKKSISYAENGDFASTGSANIRYFKKLPETMIRFTGGSFDYYRGFKLIRKPAIHNQEARNMILRRILLISADSIPRPLGRKLGSTVSHVHRLFRCNALSCVLGVNTMKMLPKNTHAPFGQK